MKNKPTLREIIVPAPLSPSLSACSQSSFASESNEEFFRSLPLDTGFDRGLEPEKIVGISDMADQLFFVMKWQMANETDLGEFW